MAISFINSAANSSSPTADTTVTLPGSMAANDLIIAVAAFGDNDNVNVDMTVATRVVTSGYTIVPDSEVSRSSGAAQADVNHACYYKYHNGSDTTFVVEGGSATGADSALAVALMVFRGVMLAAGGGPFTTTPVSTTGTDSSDANPPSIATSAGDVVVIAGSTGILAGSSSTWTAPSNYTTNAVQRFHDDTSDVMVGMGYRTSGYGNPENPGTWTASNVGTATNNAWASTIMTLLPAPETVTMQVGNVNIGF